MTRFLMARLGQAVLTLLAVSILVFLLGRLTGSPVEALLPLDATPGQRQRLTHDLGLDKSLVQQYFIYIEHLLRGDFGTSVASRVPVRPLVEERLVNSVNLVLCAIVIAIVVGTVFGVVAAVRRGNPIDRMISAFTMLGQSVPAFLSGIVAILIFSVWLDWFPAQGVDSYSSFVLPAVTMSWATSAGVARLVRSALIDSLNAEFVKLVRAAGQREAVIVWQHALKNAIVPGLNYVGISFGLLVGSAVATEVVFGWPGLARLSYEAVLGHDYPVLQGAVIVWALLIVIVNVVVDVLHAVLDPRVRVGSVA